MTAVRAWVAGLIADPDGSPSSCRVSGLLCVVVACAMALWGMGVGREQSATVTALLGGGAAALFARRKSSEVAP